jgi:hypothetical protein
LLNRGGGGGSRMVSLFLLSRGSNPLRAIEPPTLPRLRASHYDRRSRREDAGSTAQAEFRRSR